MQPVIVTTSCGSLEEAEKIAQQLLEKRLAACVQITSAQSMYWWQGAIVSEKEYLLTIKSKKSFFPRLALQIKANHSYEVPEIIAMDIAAIQVSYENWLKSELAEPE